MVIMYLSEKSFQGGGLFNPRKLEEDHEDFSDRLRKTLYYGKLPGTDRPSLPVTDLMVDFYNEAAPRELGKLDNYLAASTARSACVSPSATVVGMMYVNRLKSRRPDYLTQVSSSELFLISMMMASKFLYDEGIDDEVYNDEWANSADVETEDVNQLEKDFLAAIDWHLFVRNDDFSGMLQKIEKRVALKQGLDRGWFTYTDLSILTEDLKFNWNDLTMELSTVFSAASLAYLAGLLTMVGSTMLGSMTSVTLMNAGSAVIPLVCRITPSLSLYPILSVHVMESMSMERHPRSQLVDVMGTDANDELDPLELLPESNESVAEKYNQDGASDLGRQSQVKVIHKEQGGLLNGFLPPFLALVTLKNTLFNFAYGAALSTESNNPPETNDLDLDESDSTFDPTELGEFCSDGPCLVDSWKNCRNITVSSDWTLQNRYLDNQMQNWKLGCSKCASCNDINNHHRNRYDSYYDDEIIQCCCSPDNHGNSWLKSSLQLGMFDFNLRFDTRSVYPIFVTT